MPIRYILEELVIQNPLVERVVLFGRERDQPGLLIQPVLGYELDSADENVVSIYKNNIWYVSQSVRGECSN